MSIDTKIVCPTCNISFSEKQVIYDYEMGEQICSRCGTVLGEQRNNDFFTPDSFIDIYGNIKDTIIIEDRSNYVMGHESRMYGSRGSGLTGAGANIITSFTETMDFSSAGIMSSQMDAQNVDYLGVKIKDTKTTERMRYHNKIISSPNNKNPNEKNAKAVILLIKQISQKKYFPPFIQERAVILYRNISKKNDVKRLQYKVTAYWCLYYTLREENLTPSLPEFLNWLVELGFIEPTKKTTVQKKINKAQSFILDLMGMEAIPHTSFINNIVFLCNKHQLPELIKRQCLELGNIINDMGGGIAYQGRSPKTITTMLIAIIMRKEGLDKECKELLKELKITNIVIKKIIGQIIDIIRKIEPDKKTKQVMDLEELLNTF